MNRTLLWVFALVTLASCQQPKSKVVSVEPAPQSAVAVDLEVITVAFDRAMDPATINESTFVVTGTVTGAVTGVVFYNDVTDVAEFRPAANFSFGEVVTVQLTSAIKSASSKSLKRFSTTFVVEAAPTFELESSSPSNEALAVSRLSSLELTYSSPYNPFTATAAAVRVTGDRGGSRVVSFVDLFTGTATLRANLDRAFLPGERVHVNVSALSALAGITAADHIVSFVAANDGGDWPASTLLTGAGADGTLIVFFDGDQDGADEWAIVEPNGAVNTFDHNGSTVDTIDTFTLPESIRAAVAGDFNEDGRVDVVCLSQSGDNLYLLRGSASSAALLSAPTVIASGLTAVDMVATNFNVDGAQDLVLRANDGVRVLLGDATSALLNGFSVSDLDSTTNVVAGDLDGDLLPDLAGTDASGALIILYNNGDESFSRANPLLPTGSTIALRLGNFDGDNLIDLLAIAANGEVSSLFLSDGDDQFSVATLAADVATTATVVSDFDGDGNLDLLTPDASSGVLLFAGRGDASFTAGELQATSNRVGALSLGDVNGDGALDVGLALGTLGWEIGLANANIVSTFGNRMELSPITAAVGASGVPFEVRADHEDALSGFTVVIGYDPDLVTIDSLTSVGTDAGAVGVEFEIPSIDNVNGVAALGAIFDFGPPFDNQALAPGADDLIAVGTLTLSSDMSSGVVDFGLENGIDSPPKDNNFTVGGFSVLPSLVNGTVTATAGNSGGGGSNTFLRGDVNGDGTVNIADGTTLSSFLFTNGAPPVCEDAADVNDDGALTIIDSTMLNAFLFSGGSAPPAPFPAAGVDPTNDSLNCGPST